MVGSVAHVDTPPRVVRHREKHRHEGWYRGLPKAFLLFAVALTVPGLTTTTWGKEGEEVATRTPTTLGAHLTRQTTTTTFLLFSFLREKGSSLSSNISSQSSGSGKRSGDEEGSLSVHAVRALIPKGIAILSLSLFFFFPPPAYFSGARNKEALTCIQDYVYFSMQYR